MFSRKNTHMSVKRRSRAPGFGVRLAASVYAHPAFWLAIALTTGVEGGCGDNHSGATGGAGGATARSAGAIKLLIVAKGS